MEPEDEEDYHCGDENQATQDEPTNNRRDDGFSDSDPENGRDSHLGDERSPEEAEVSMADSRVDHIVNNTQIIVNIFSG